MTPVSLLAQHVAFGQGTTFDSIGDSVVPWVVSSLDDDYRELRYNAGLVDLTGCGLLAVTGAGAEDLLDAALARDCAYMTPERTMMGLLVAEDGRPIDIVTLYRRDDGYLVQTSVGQGERVASVLRELAEDADVTDARTELAAIGIEGPQAVRALGKILEEPVEGLPFQTVRPARLAGRPQDSIVLSRTGFTGEFGFTLLVPWAEVAETWDALASAAVAVGIGALETAMVEIRQPILYRELFDDDTVLTAGLNWLVDLQKEEFVGRDAIVAEFDGGQGRGRLSIVSDAPLSRGTQLALAGEIVGEVAHAVRSPSLEAWCAVARVRRDVQVAGLAFDVAGGGVARSVSSPAIAPSSWAALQG